LSAVSAQVAISTFTDAITINRLERNLVRLDCKETHPWTFLRDIAKPFVEDAKKKRIEYGMNCDHYESTSTSLIVCRPFWCLPVVVGWPNISLICSLSRAVRRC